jgi:hypothetical protein
MNMYIMYQDNSICFKVVGQGKGDSNYDVTNKETGNTQVRK